MQNAFQNIQLNSISRFLGISSEGDMIFNTLLGNSTHYCLDRPLVLLLYYIESLPDPRGQGLPRDIEIIKIITKRQRQWLD